MDEEVWYCAIPIPLHWFSIEQPMRTSSRSDVSASIISQRYCIISYSGSIEHAHCAS